MKPVPIPMKQWLAANERTRVLPGDQWYLNFSASILSLVKQSPLFKEDDYAQKDATVSVSYTHLRAHRDTERSRMPSSA